MLGTSRWLTEKLGKIESLQGYSEDKRQAASHFRRIITIFIHPIHSPIIISEWKTDDSNFSGGMSTSSSSCFCHSHRKLLCSFPSFYQLYLQPMELQMVQVFIIVRYQCKIQAIYKIIHERFNGFFLMPFLPRLDVMENKDRVQIILRH